MTKKVKKNNKDVADEGVEKFFSEWDEEASQEERIQGLIELAKEEERAAFYEILEETLEKERAKHKKEIDALKIAHGKDKQHQWDEAEHRYHRDKKEAFQEGASDSNLGWFVLLIPVVIFLYNVD